MATAKPSVLTRPAVVPAFLPGIAGGVFGSALSLVTLAFLRSSS